MFSYMYIFSHNKKYALYLISLLGRGYIYIYFFFMRKISFTYKACIYNVRCLCTDI